MFFCVSLTSHLRASNFTWFYGRGFQELLVLRILAMSILSQMLVEVLSISDLQQVLFCFFDVDGCSDQSQSIRCIFDSIQYCTLPYRSFSTNVLVTTNVL